MSRLRAPPTKGPWHGNGAKMEGKFATSNAAAPILAGMRPSAETGATHRQDYVLAALAVAHVADDPRACRR
jgi:hypothetical protein